MGKKDKMGGGVLFIKIDRITSAQEIEWSKSEKKSIFYHLPRDRKIENSKKFKIFSKTDHLSIPPPRCRKVEKLKKNNNIIKKFNLVICMTAHWEDRRTQCDLRRTQMSTMRNRLGKGLLETCNIKKQGKH